ncbi:hypothetical protein CspeluHIS016_0900780 [Cutaneotrichosporon spelunceum]|uniref:Uncharacterized protein n=1 Tax=Cutaneotrichosporon spelunceum TaxID=1672016 RepID=A0AAD3TZQ2_9TREE|nr:hypothetical protein CspeluHIS016_0900780 [Cutaneotrichosporon spelunceum]
MRQHSPLQVHVREPVRSDAEAEVDADADAAHPTARASRADAARSEEARVHGHASSRDASVQDLPVWRSRCQIDPVGADPRLACYVGSALGCVRTAHDVGLQR